MSVQEHARALRESVPAFAAGVADRIQAEVPTYAGSPEGRRRELIEDGVARATHRYLDTFDGMPHRDRGVDALFQSMGRGEATQTGDLSALQASLRLAASLAWRSLRRLATEQPVPDDALGKLADELFQLVDHLVEQAELGFRAGLRAVESDVGLARARVAEQLLSGRPLAAGETIDPAVWKSPEWVVVVVAEPDRQPDFPALARHGLVVPQRSHIVVIAAADNADQVVSTLGDASPRVAVSWPVESAAIPAALRWARRALDLVRRGVIPDQPVIECRKHRTQIWLHAEPDLRQRLTQNLLKPLLAETPNSREILSETMLTWLETRDSAPAIAAKLGVHPQTVRYRWKRINELFGENLHNPEFTIQITMLLKASVPLWKAGDQSDFELFRAEEEG